MALTTFWEARVWLTQDFVIIHFITGTILDLIKNSRQEKTELPSVTVVCLADQHSSKSNTTSEYQNMKRKGQNTHHSFIHNS